MKLVCEQPYDKQGTRAHDKNNEKNKQGGSRSITFLIER